MGHKVVRHTRKWLIKDNEEILLSGSALGDQFKEQQRDLQERGFYISRLHH